MVSMVETWKEEVLRSAEQWLDFLSAERSEMRRWGALVGRTGVEAAEAWGGGGRGRAVEGQEPR